MLANLLAELSITQKTTTNKSHEIIKSHITHIFTFEPSVFWDDPEEADVVHMYIIAVVLYFRYYGPKRDIIELTIISEIISERKVVTH